MTVDQDTMDKVCRRALVEWGEDAQTTMPMEEMGELIAAISHYRRGRISKEEMAGEIADVRVCLRQLEIMVGTDTCREELHDTIMELNERLPARSET